MGASIGVILGVSFVAYVTANKEQETIMQGKNERSSPKIIFDTSQRVVWHKKNENELVKKFRQSQLFRFNLSF